MKMIFVGNLPSDATEQEITQLFSTHGRVRSLRLVRDAVSYTHLDVYKRQA